jgi:DNA-binding response OmpR family regulator
MDEKKILIVDDEHDFVDLVKLRLENNNYQVLTAYDGEEALNIAAQEKPDLVLLDILMPKIDGIKVCQKLKNNPLTAGIAVVVLTAKDRPEDIKIAKQAGSDEYIVKPFDDQTLLFSIKQLLNRVKGS